MNNFRSLHRATASSFSILDCVQPIVKKSSRLWIRPTLCGSKRKKRSDFSCNATQTPVWLVRKSSANSRKR
uniref:Uncharacterized protein n=1 Tax=Rhizophora mucronata TaxID=61149 RepID=A0A2P2PJK2_RHIMU